VLEAYWDARAFEAAGVDPADWDPSLGADHNRETILAVYECYGRLNRGDPAMQWAGLANLVGPGFAASFFDLDMIRGAAGTLADLPDLPGDLTDPFRDLAGSSDEQLAFYERTSLPCRRTSSPTWAPCLRPTSTAPAAWRASRRCTRQG